MESEGNVEGKTVGYRGGELVRQRGCCVLWWALTPSKSTDTI